MAGDNSIMTNQKEEDPKPQTLIVLRFSAMGDVAMLASAITELVQQYPALKIVLVSRAAFRPLFAQLPQVVFHPIFPKQQHKGITGLYRLSKELKCYNADAIADQHGNIRSKILSFFCKGTNVRLVLIDKGRKEKRELTRKKNKILVQLKPTVERYRDVFAALDLPFTLKHILQKSSRLLNSATAAVFRNTAKKYVGISPFAQHEYKVYPLQKLSELFGLLADHDIQLFIFGGGEKEKAIAAGWENNNVAVTSLIGRFNLAEELNIISKLDLMLSMDSAGMHLASLVGTKVVSVWGPTHPFAGFLGYGQSMENCVQVDHPLRPNSVFGNKPCFANGVTCIELVSVKMIADKIFENLDIKVENDS